MNSAVNDHPALALFTELLSVPSPSAREEQLAQIVKRRLESWGFAPEIDASGNVIVRVPGRRSDAGMCCFMAHIDEIGMAVTAVQPDGSLLVTSSGGLQVYKHGEGPVEVLGDYDSAPGILSLGSTHVQGADQRVITWQNARIITGLTPAELRTLGIRPGSVAVPQRAVCGPYLLGKGDDPLVAAWTLDDRMGAVALLRLLHTLKEEQIVPDRPTVVVFTTQEETGGHGAKAFAMAEHPEMLIAIDGCPITPGAPLTMDGRPGIWSRDRLAHYDQRLLVELCEAARAAGTELQPVCYDATGSDAGLVLAVGGARRVACLGQVRENSHGYEVARLSVFDNLWRTLVQFVRTHRA
jgi:putative aminopeptidase FrvX